MKLLKNPVGGEDFKLFKLLTWGKNCVIGANTIKKIQSLPGRVFIPVSEMKDGDVVIGGYKTYMECWPRIDLLYMSVLKEDLSLPTIGDSFVNNLDGFCFDTVVPFTQIQINIYKRF